MHSVQLLAIVEVPHDERVRCQANGCNHPVFRRIHVVQDESGIHVYGSECFKKLFLGLPVASSTPAYTSAEGRSLTDEERQLLIENTARLIQQLEAEYQTEIARKAAFAQATARPAPDMLPSPTSHQGKRTNPPAEWLVVEAQAKATVRSKYGVDPELPGWHGIVLMEMKRIVGKKLD